MRGDRFAQFVQRDVRRGDVGQVTRAVEGHGERAEVPREPRGKERRRFRRRQLCRVIVDGCVCLGFRSLHEPNADAHAPVPRERGRKRPLSRTRASFDVLPVVKVVHALGERLRSENQRRQLDRHTCRDDIPIRFRPAARLSGVHLRTRERHDERGALPRHRSHDVLVHDELVRRSGPRVARHDARGSSRDDERVVLVGGDKLGAVGQGVRDRHGRGRRILGTLFGTFLGTFLGVLSLRGWFIDGGLGGLGGGFVLRGWSGGRGDEFA